MGRLVGEVQGDQKTARGCYVETVKEDQKWARTQGKAIEALVIFEAHVLKEAAPRRSAIEEGDLVEIVGSKATWVAHKLEPKAKEDLIACL